MSNKPCVLAIDQGTTSSRAIVFDNQANQISVAQQEFPRYIPMRVGLNTIRKLSGKPPWKPAVRQCWRPSPRV
ncbi:MAG: FGGY family carbohydrate kinase [Porticoccaceae bacterium]